MLDAERFACDFAKIRHQHLKVDTILKCLQQIFSLISLILYRWCSWYVSVLQYRTFATRSMRFYPDFQIIRFFQICSLYSKLVFSSKSNFLCSTIVFECTVLFYVLIGWYTERIGPWRYFCLSANKTNLNALPDRGWTWTKWLHFLLESPSVDHHVTSKLELEIFWGRFPWSKFILHQIRTRTRWHQLFSLSAELPFTDDVGTGPWVTFIGTYFNS